LARIVENLGYREIKPFSLKDLLARVDVALRRA
jgi:hypothetical protein